MSVNARMAEKHLNILSFLLLSISLWATVSGCGDHNEKAPDKTVRPVKLMKVGAIQDRVYHFYPAKIRSSQRVKLAFQVAGQIINFPPKAGNQVKKGQLLGELDPRDYENTFKSAESKYKESQTDYERYNHLVGKKAVSVAVFQEKRKAFEVAEADMKIAAKALADTKLIAPFDGVVAGTYVNNFQNIQAKEEILSLQGTSDIELVINVPEKDVINFHSDLSLAKLNEMVQPAAVFPALKNHVFPLQLKEFETEADSATQTFRAVLAMPSPKEFSIMPGMTALVRVVNGRDGGETPGCRIPAAAVGEDNRGKPYVWIVDKKMTVSQRRITVGVMSGDRIIVKQGLAEGETIVISGVGFLAEGMVVKELTHIDDYTVTTTTGAGK